MGGASSGDGGGRGGDGLDARGSHGVRSEPGGDGAVAARRTEGREVGVGGEVLGALGTHLAHGASAGEAAHGAADSEGAHARLGGFGKGMEAAGAPEGGEVGGAVAGIEGGDDGKNDVRSAGHAADGGDLLRSAAARLWIEGFA